MNDQPPHADYEGYATGGFGPDPLFGSLPGQQYQWDTGAQQTVGYDTYTTQQLQQDDPQQYEAWVPAQPASPDSTGQWSTATWADGSSAHTGEIPVPASYAAYDYGTVGYDTGSYDTTGWHDVSPADTGAHAVIAPDTHGGPDAHSGPGTHGGPDTAEFAAIDVPGLPEPTADFDFDPAPEHSAHSVGHAPAGRAAGRGRGRRRTPVKRSALLTVAVPSACVMGVAGIAAASVSGLTGSADAKNNDSTTTLAAADPASVKPVAANSKLDTQLANLSADADDFADRASRTQERIDLKARQAAEKKKREAEAARKEALRPKFALPVKQHGLSASFGQAGINWMSVHTGIDFPVDYGVPVMAATDGTVRTQWNSAYGNMAIVTSPDGTETWYCHLGSTKIRSGSVKAGDVIGYSGSTGNSTGPHLHFEVRPGGGAPIDPAAWFRSHGLNPN
ncbi:M23 family metallopeptidase [Streptomyces sp. NPDC050504]|uniref:M23 family metallopeptidase n=1 Tax=Streptomyces sp. NPDC050504 TaxID=3365618 RepID=UPI00378AC4A4